MRIIKGKDKQGKTKEIILLNPHEQSAKALQELKDNCRYCNDLVYDERISKSGKPYMIPVFRIVKKDKNGRKQKLTLCQKLFRQGQINQQKSNDRAWLSRAKKHSKNPRSLYDYSANFDFDDKGRIRGRTNANGRFEPD